MRTDDLYLYTVNTGALYPLLRARYEAIAPHFADGVGPEEVAWAFVAPAHRAAVLYRSEIEDAPAFTREEIRACALEIARRFHAEWLINPHDFGAS